MRVWLIEDRAGPANVPSYKPSMRGGAPSRNFGALTYIEIPNPDRLGKFKVIGTIQSAAERAQMDLVGRYDVDQLSDLMRIAEKGCDVDVQIHMGKCQNPASLTADGTKSSS